MRIIYYRISRVLTPTSALQTFRPSLAREGQSPEQSGRGVSQDKNTNLMNLDFLSPLFRRGFGGGL